MKSIAFARLARWLNLPAGLLIALLQRTPLVRIAMEGAEEGLVASTGAVLRSAVGAVAALGALDTLAGATTSAIMATPGIISAGTVGTPYSGEAFTVPTAAFPSSWQVLAGSTVPPGLNFSGLSAPGVINVDVAYLLLSGTPTTAGTYTFTLMGWEYPNGTGLNSLPATYTVVVKASVTPVFTTQPAPATVTPGASAAFAVIATKATSYQWQLNGQNVTQANAAGATTPTLFLSNTSAANVGNYTCIASNGFGSTTSTGAALALAATTTPGHLINLSILSDITGSLTMGFVNGGAGTSGAQSLLIRAIGPSLGAPPFNYPAILPDPTLTVVQQNTHTTLATNAGWGTPAGNVALVQAADNATGAFALTNPASLDSALVESLPGVSGGYSAVAAGKSGDSGNAITEVYDANSSYTATSTRLINLSCITLIPAGGSLGVGFVLGGTTSKTLLVRVSGPTLATFGTPGTMTDPQLVVTPQSNGAIIIGANSGWNGDPVISAVAASIGAFPFTTSPTSHDSAVVLTMPPGTPYTVEVNSASGGGGNVLVEVYEVP